MKLFFQVSRAELSPVHRLHVHHVLHRVRSLRLRLGRPRRQPGLAVRVPRPGLRLAQLGRLAVPALHPPAARGRPRARRRERERLVGAVERGLEDGHHRVFREKRDGRWLRGGRVQFFEAREEEERRQCFNRAVVRGWERTVVA